jgi:hypothetical protein
MFCSGLRQGQGPEVSSSQLGLAEAAAVDELEIVDDDALLVDRGRPRRHRARRHAADIGMVAAAGDPEQDLVPAASKTGVTTVMSGRCVPPL